MGLPRRLKDILIFSQFFIVLDLLIERKRKIKHTKSNLDEFTVYKNDNGVEIAVKDCGILEVDGYAFKNLSKSDKLLPYGDWRLSAEDRANDLASRLSVDEIAGLMLYSSHQLVPARPMGPFVSHYDGKLYEEGVTVTILFN